MLSNLCELLGLGGITTGVWMSVGAPAGLTVGGICLVIVGLALDGVKFRKP